MCTIFTNGIMKELQVYKTDRKTNLICLIKKRCSKSEFQGQNLWLCRTVCSLVHGILGKMALETFKLQGSQSVRGFRLTQTDVQTTLCVFVCIYIIWPLTKCKSVLCWRSSLERKFVVPVKPRPYLQMCSNTHLTNHLALSLCLSLCLLKNMENKCQWSLIPLLYPHWDAVTVF